MRLLKNLWRCFAAFRRPPAPPRPPGSFADPARPSPGHAVDSFFLDSVKMISYCPTCGRSYRPTEALIVEEEEASFLLFIRCGNCAGAIYAAVFISEIGVSSQGTVVDLTFDEVRRFRREEAREVSTDDVLAIHHLLREGDMRFLVKHAYGN